MVASLFCLFLLVAYVGQYRTDVPDFSVASLLDVFVFRVSEFFWPMGITYLVDSSIVKHQPSLFFSGLFGALPSFVSIEFLGSSVFQRDTILMESFGLGRPTMSVPLTIIGEGYLWGGIQGVLIIGALSGLAFGVVEYFIGALKPLVGCLLFVQMLKNAFLLSVASFPELVSFFTKDLLLSLLLALIAASFVKKVETPTVLT